ncbi:MAG: prepilin peptidase [Bacillota bacterium]|nr:prepilin peptidase [Bacillota bacterium]MDW7677011.1 prepilin peptidase [Bacillota bacterium]
MTIIDIILLTTIGICLITDIRKQKIYNKVLLPALILGLGGNIIVNGFPGLQSSILGLILGIGLLIFPHLAGGIGAGDVKLMGVIGILKGPAFVFQAFLAAAIVGGIIALMVLARNRVMKETLRRLGTAFMSLLLMIPRGAVTEGLQSPKAISFPYGIAISIGTIAAYFIG